MISKAEWNHFLNSEIWRELRGTLELRLDQAHNSLESCPAEELGTLQGACKEVRFLLELPKLLAIGE